MIATSGRSLRHRRLATAACLLVGMAIPSAHARQPQTQPATSPATNPATEPSTVPTAPPTDAATAERAKGVLERALARYHAARTYQDKLELTDELVAFDKGGTDVGYKHELSAAVAFARPNRVALETDQFAICSDGQQLWVLCAALGQYTAGGAPAQLDLSALHTALRIGQPPHPVLYILTQPDKPLAELFPMVSAFVGVTPETRDGRPGQRISGLADTARSAFLRGAQLALPFSVWVDDETGLLGEVRLDLTPVYQKALAASPPNAPGRPERIERAVTVVRFRDVKLDADVSPQRFVFKPPADAVKVDQFTWGRPANMPDPRKLIGQPAPAISGTGLDGQPLALADLRGRVVVLDFWATWCGPCVQALPHLQKIAAKFAGQPVTFIGVNRDGKGTEAKVRKFVEERKLTFRQFMDIADDAVSKYKVVGIPCTFVIDAQGTVQLVHSGFDPKLEKQFTAELTTAIEKLLKGESLVAPAQPAAASPPATQPPG